MDDGRIGHKHRKLKVERVGMRILCSNWLDVLFKERFLIESSLETDFVHFHLQYWRNVFSC